MGVGETWQRTISVKSLNTIGYVLSRYGRLPARNLENRTHAESPWQRANQTRSHWSNTRTGPGTENVQNRSPVVGRQASHAA